MISTYAELKDAVQDWLGGRTDLSARVDEFIALCEADINSLPDFRLREMEADALLETNSNGDQLPDDYLEWRQVTYLSNPRRPLTFVAPSTVEQWYADRAASSPSSNFTIINNALYTHPFTDADDVIELLYYRKVPPLSAAGDFTTNWLLTKKPNVYLFGTLAYAAVYIMDDAMQKNYFGRYSAAMMELIAADRGARYARAAVRQPGPTP